ncbi:hypothetical protein BZA05DRAFT_260533 [Tricharina praecox]|uniref:uncharacterized protein n=1 Tax=Tricharina praecox TaxID=43433 RepID=UPI00221E4118|nr:uncharacterized protein BZA05DRAFT_260533 [Tricharina praecox]KAI5854224.1 hypothetical protein BZA05DRAFT_260533 [Tricharina praecox]
MHSALFVAHRTLLGCFVHSCEAGVTCGLAASVWSADNARPDDGVCNTLLTSTPAAETIGGSGRSCTVDFVGEFGRT